MILDTVCSLLRLTVKLSCDALFPTLFGFCGNFWPTVLFSVFFTLKSPHCFFSFLSNCFFSIWALFFPCSVNLWCYHRLHVRTDVITLWRLRLRATGELRTRSWWCKSRINFSFDETFPTLSHFKISRKFPAFNFSFLIYCSSLLIYLIDQKAEFAGFIVASFRLNLACKSTQNLLLYLKRKFKMSSQNNTIVLLKTMYMKKNLCVESVVTLFLLRLVVVLLEFFFPKKVLYICHYFNLKVNGTDFH